jgi:glycosyltransferase involved in cell wall biosynthesis
VNQPLRILHIASGDLWAGAEVAVFHLACALHANSGVRIRVALLNEGELASRLRDSGIPVRVFDEQRHGVFNLLLQIHALIRQWQPHIVHTHRGKEHLLGTLAAALVPGAISLRTVHGSLESIGHRRSRLRDKVLQNLDQHIARLQSHAIAVSAPLASELGKSLPHTPIRTIVNGIDCRAIQAAAAQSSAVVAADRIGICFSGRLVPVKRVDVFLAAARLVLDACPDRYRFYVVGDGPLRAQLEAQAQQLQMGSNCVFIGFLPNALPLLSRMGALVLTSDHEGTPMVALEALALGAPVVAHAVGGLVPLLGSAAQGQLVPSQNPAEIAKGIITAAPPDRLVPTGRRNLLPAEYHIEASAAAHLALYRELLDDRAKRN